MIRFLSDVVLSSMKMWALKSHVPNTAPHTGGFVGLYRARLVSREDLKSNGLDTWNLIQKGVLSSDWMKLEVMEPEPRRLVPYSASGPFLVWIVTERPLTKGMVMGVEGG